MANNPLGRLFRYDGDTDWMDDGACLRFGNLAQAQGSVVVYIDGEPRRVGYREFMDSFFPYKNGDWSIAAACCEICEVKETCGEYAINNPSLSGIWGGMTNRDRREARETRAERGAA